MGDPHKARTWAELKAWFTGEDRGRLVAYSPDTNPEWDDLWLAFDGDDSEIGRGMRSQSLSIADLRWLHTVLTLWLGEPVDDKAALREQINGEWNATVEQIEARALAAEAECERLRAALGKPCAECGHIDWRECSLGEADGE